MIKVLFFANLKETLGCSELQVEVQQTVADLRAKLGEHSEQWAKVLSHGSTLVAVNQAMANEQTAIKDGDEVAFFPPVTGG